MKVWRRIGEDQLDRAHIKRGGVKTGRRRKILVNDNKEPDNGTGWDIIMTGDSLQSEIIEGRMDCKRGRRRSRKKLLDWMMSEEYSKLKEEAQHRESPMKPLEVWTCQRAENLKKKSSKISINNNAATMVSAARRQIIGGGGAPINISRRRRPQIVGGGGAARPAHSSISRILLASELLCIIGLLCFACNYSIPRDTCRGPLVIL